MVVFLVAGHLFENLDPAPAQDSSLYDWKITNIKLYLLRNVSKRIYVIRLYEMFKYNEENLYK